METLKMMFMMTRRTILCKCNVHMYIHVQNDGNAANDDDHASCSFALVDFCDDEKIMV